MMFNQPKMLNQEPFCICLISWEPKHEFWNAILAAQARYLKFVDFVFSMILSTIYMP